MKVYKNYCLLGLNTFNLNVVAKEFILINDINDFNKLNLLDKYYILGRGSNTLFVADKYQGTIIHFNLKGYHIKSETDEDIVIEVMAGESWEDLVWNVVEKGWSGIENLVSIPGSVGGAVVQNIGAYGVELKDVLVEVRYFNLIDNKFYVLKNSQCEFDYRFSVFKKKNFQNKAIIISATLKLSKILKNLKLDYPGISEELKIFGKTSLTPKIIANAIYNIRKRKLPDYKVLGNAGSIFKNPIVDLETFQNLYIRYPDLVFFKLPNESNKVKLSAGWLIEKCGLKGFCLGDACIYQNHALIIINKGNAKGIDILNLINKIKSSVLSNFNVLLEEEISIIC